MPIIYQPEPQLCTEQFKQILLASTLATRRPVDETDRLETMLRCADIIVTARHGGRLIGVSRAITDFAFACYLSDLAVDEAYQRQGIGKQLIAETHKIAGAKTTLYLVSAPAAEGYYPRIGMTHVPSCWKFPALG